MTILATSPVPADRRIDRADTVSITATRNAHAEPTILANGVGSTDVIPVTYVSSTAVCPPWCSKSHLSTDDDAVLHLSVDGVVPATGGGRAEWADAFVSVERLDLPGTPVDVPNVRLEGGGIMTPLEALQLASALQAFAFAALLDAPADTDEVLGWAEALAVLSPTEMGMRHGYTEAQAAEVQRIVAELAERVRGGAA